MPASIIAFLGAAGVESGLGALLFRAVAGFVVSTVIQRALAPKPKTASFDAGASAAGLNSQNRTVSVRQPIAPRQQVYGQVRVGGIITWVQIDPTDKTRLHMVITFAGHICAEIGDIYFNDELVPLQDNTNSIGKYHGYAYVAKSLGGEPDGSPSAQPFPDLVVASGGEWTDAHRQSGCAKIYVQLFWNADLFPSGLPNISAVLRGKKVLDPRFGSPSVYAWTDNAALCQLDYLTDRTAGIGADYGTEIDNSDLIAAANACDEEVLFAAGKTYNVTFDEATGQFTLPATARLPRIGTGVRLTPEGSPPAAMPAALAAGVTYYVIHAGAGLVKLASSLANARTGTALTIGASPALTGACALTLYSEPRYTVNGSFKCDAQPKTVLETMLGASAGKAINVGGKWHLFCGVYSPPTLSFDEGDLAGAIKVQSLVSRRENANGVKGVYTDPDNWQPTDFPALGSATYLAEDGERVWRDVDYSPFVVSGTQAQRLSKIELLMLRQGLTVIAPFKLSAWAAMTGNVLTLDNARFGWVAKPFEVLSSKLTIAGDGTLGVELTLRETAAAVFDWATSEEQAVDLAPNTSLPNPLEDLDLEDLVATSGTADLLVQGDGTVVPRVRLRWTRPANGFLSYYEIQFSRSSVSPSEWADAPDVAAPLPGVPNEGFAFPVIDGESVNLRVRAVTTFGNAGAWAYVYGHTVVGKTEPPSDVTGAVAYQNGGVIVFGCDTVPDADLDLIEVRWLDLDDEEWNNGIPVANILRGQQLPSASIPAGTFTFLFKAKDTSGNYSDNVDRADLTVSNAGYTTISEKVSSPDWIGHLDGFVVSVSGALVPDSTLAASSHTNVELFEQYVPHPVTISTFTAPEVDKTMDGTVRVYADIVSTLGRGITDGIAMPSHQIDTRLAAGSYDGYENWQIGTANFRYLASRIRNDNSIGKVRITRFVTTVDAATRTEDGTYTTTAGGSVAVSYTNPFHVAPGVVVSPEGSGDVSASTTNKTTTGFTGYFKSAGVAAAGTASYKATGA